MAVSSQEAVGLMVRSGVRAWPVVRPVAVFARREPFATACGLLLLLSLVVAALAPLLTPHDPFAQDVPRRLLGPSLTHPAGTDHLGRDLFSRIVLAARYSLGIGFGAVAVSIGFGLLLGVASAYSGRVLDIVVQRCVDGIMSIPVVLLLILIVTLLGPSILTVVIALGFSQGIRNSRVVRGAALEVLAQDYVDAARVLGASWLRIVLRYLLPNIAAPIIVLASVGLGGAILAESIISFLGYGVPPPEPTWGQMLGVTARPYFVVAPWTAIAPGIALSLVVFAINIFSDGLRDHLDPRLRGR